MASQSRRADLIVGIDVGMTCTGVAYSYGPDWPSPKPIQHWPGRLAHEIRNKVDTCISYDRRTNGSTSWGFLCNPEDDQRNARFKLHLDPNHKDPVADPPSCETARRWYTDYLKHLYQFLLNYFAKRLPRFASSSVDFVFSVPVTWRTHPAMIPDIEHFIRAAGFGSRYQDSASVYLSEAEAAAIYASKGLMKERDVFLVCDAGGGTIDLNVLRVESTSGTDTHLLPLSWTEGAAVGSAIIDDKIRRIVEQRIATVEDYLDESAAEIAARMMIGAFEGFKCGFGTPGLEVPRLDLPVPGLKAGIYLPLAGIEDSKVVITSADLQAIFDDQIDTMCVLIDRQLYLAQQRYPNDHVSYLVLSGGFGSSPYVQSRIRERFVAGAFTPWEQSSQLQLLLADEPQMAVANGLVAARVQLNKGRPDILAERCCPASFGILFRELYDPVKHQGETAVVQDKFDKRKWAEGQIHWILKQGQVVTAGQGVSEKYNIKIPMGKEHEPWSTVIVMSTLPVEDLPTSIGFGRARQPEIVCKLQTTLTPRDMKRKNRHWYNLKPEYNLAEFLVRMIIDTSLRFEIWSVDGTIRSRSHDELTVEWTDFDRSAALFANTFELPPASPKRDGFVELDACGVCPEGSHIVAELPGSAVPRYPRQP